jgi:hypothetical protein
LAEVWTKDQHCLIFSFILTAYHQNSGILRLDSKCRNFSGKAGSDRERFCRLIDASTDVRAAAASPRYQNDGYSALTRGDKVQGERDSYNSSQSTALGFEQDGKEKRSDSKLALLRPVARQEISLRLMSETPCYNTSKDSGAAMISYQSI